MNTVGRKRFPALVTLALLATFGLAACSSSSKDAAQPGGTDTIRYMFTPGVLTELPVLVANHAGLFADAHIKLDLVDKPASLPAVQGLMASGADLGTMATASLVQGWQAGSDVTMFCGGARYIDTTIVAGPKSTYPSAANGASPAEVIRSLSGKRIGVMAPVGSALQLQIAATFDQFEATGVKYVLVGTTPAVIRAALAHGDVDAVASLAPTTQLLTYSGAARSLLFLPDVPGMSHDAYGGGYVAKRSWVDAHHDAAKRFCDVIRSANSYMHDAANAATVENVISDSLRVDADQARYLLKNAIPTIDTSLPVDVLRQTFHLYLQTGIAKTSPALQYGQLIESV